MTTSSAERKKPASTICAGGCGAKLEPEPRKPVPELNLPAGWWVVETCASCEARATAEKAQREEAAHIAKLKAESGMGPLHLKMLWSSFEHRPGSPIAQKRQACLEAKRGIFLYGPPGCGKTFVAGTILNEHIDTTRTGGVFANVPKLMAHLRVALQRQPDRDHLAKLRETPCLILDDLAVEKPTDFVLEAIYNLLEDWTVNEKHRIAITSNLKPAELVDRIGDRIVSRLVGLCDVVEMTGDDRRLRR